MRTFADANEILRRYWPQNLERKAYTLDYMVELMDYLDNPQEKLKVIHVAGTSGKTSTCHYAAGLLKAAGKKVGLAASPHVDEINERAQINLVPMPEAEYCRALSAFLRLIKKSKLTSTYFELLIAFAFYEFVRQGMEYAVIEVGLGGSDDATNIVARSDKVCIITDLGLDHINVLGASLPEIAQKKSGIIQQGNTVVCYRQDREVMDVIESRVKERRAKLHALEASAAQRNLDFLPLFQQRNLGLARAAVDLSLQQNGEAPLTEAMVAEAAHTYIPARMETVEYHGRTVILDGAHNPQKLHALAESVRQKYPGQAIAAVVSQADGRSYRLDDSTKELAGLLDHIIITTFGGPKDGPHHSVDTELFASLFKKHGAKSLEVVVDPQKALAKLLRRPEPVLLVAGSFYLLNHIRPLLRR